MKRLLTDGQTNRRTDGRRTTGDQRKAHLSLRLRWAKKDGRLHQCTWRIVAKDFRFFFGWYLDHLKKNYRFISYHSFSFHINKEHGPHVLSTVQVNMSNNLIVNDETPVKYMYNVIQVLHMIIYRSDKERKYNTYFLLAKSSLVYRNKLTKKASRFFMLCN